MIGTIMKLVILVFLELFLVQIGNSNMIPHVNIEALYAYEHPHFVPTILMAKKNVQTAPLDLNENIGHALELVSNLVGILGNSVSSLTFELTGISIHDCAQNFKDKDVSEMSCDEFLEELSMCDSLGHIKPLLKSTKKRYQKIKGRAASSQLPCSRT